MINSYFRRNLEVRLNNTYHKLSTMIVEKSLVDVLKEKVALYKALEVDPDWIVTTGLSLDDTGNQKHPKGSIGQWTMEILCVSRKNPDWFVEISVQSNFSNTGTFVADTKAKIDVTNLQTHEDYEKVLEFVKKLDEAVDNVKFDDATVLFSKLDPE